MNDIREWLDSCDFEKCVSRTTLASYSIPGLAISISHIAWFTNNVVKQRFSVEVNGHEREVLMPQDIKEAALSMIREVTNDETGPSRVAVP